MITDHYEASPSPSVRGGNGPRTVLRLAVLAFAAGTTVATAQPAEQSDPLAQLLQKHYAALGGLEAWKAVETMKIEGMATVQGFEVPFTIWRQRPSFFRQVNVIQGAETITAYDGVTAWAINPMGGSDKPMKLPEEQAQAAALQGQMDGVLVSWKRLRAKLELGGIVELGDDLGSAHEIQATHKDGTQERYYLGTEDFLVKRTVRQAPQSMGGGEIVSDTLEWGTFGGLRLPVRQRNVSPMMGSAQIEIAKVELNPEIDPEIFYMPGQKADPQLTLDQILERHFDARRGGAEGTKTVRATGKLGFMGLQVPLVISLEKPNRSRLEADMAGSKMVLAFDGEQAWTVSPLQAINEPEALPAEAADLIELFGGFLWGILEGAQEKGWELTLAGIEKVERDETYRIEMKNAAGVTRTAYLGGEDFLERRFSLNAVFMGNQQDLDALLSEYEERSGLLVPAQIALNSDGAPVASVAIEDVATNVALEEGLFSLPPKPTPAEQ